MTLLSNISLTLRNSQANSITTVQNDVNLFSIQEATNKLNDHVNQVQIGTLSYINSNINIDVSTNNTWGQVVNFTLGPSELVSLSNNAIKLTNNINNVPLIFEVAFSGVAIANALIEFAIGPVGGTVEETYKQIRKWSVNDTGSVSMIAAHTYLANEEIGLFIKDTNAKGGNVIVQYCQFKVSTIAP
jgi:hypothetical protein